MMKSILTLATFLTISIASAQSYPKQPDPRVYTVIDNSVKKTENQEQTVTEQEQRKDDVNESTEIKSSDSSTSNNVSENNGVAINNRKENE